MSYTPPMWRGPICIDNMARGSSVGDQFVARALALLNDTVTVKIVNTIGRFLLLMKISLGLIGMKCDDVVQEILLSMKEWEKESVTNAD